MALRLVADTRLFVYPGPVAVTEVVRGFQPRDPWRARGLKCASSNCLESLSTAWRLFFLSSLAIWGFRTTDSASRSAAQALLERSLSGEADQEDEGTEAPRGILATVRTPGGGEGSAVVRGSGQCGSRVLERGHNSARRTRSGLDTALGVVCRDPAAGFGGVLQHHSAGAANSGAATRGTQFNVLGCSSDLVAGS